MKKIVFVVLVCFVGSLERVGAQVNFAVGVKAGVNISNFNVKNPVAGTEFNFQSGFNVGVMTWVKVFNKFGVQPEILFSRQGASVKVDIFDLIVVQDYISIPVMLKYYLIGGLNIQFGPQVGFLAEAEADILVPSTAGGQAVKTVDATDDFEDIDFGLVAGLGWDLPLGLTVDARYNIGLIALTDNKDLPFGDDPKNQVIQISVGYKLFQLGKN